jgi:hypothetical protein
MVRIRGEQFGQMAAALHDDEAGNGFSVSMQTGRNAAAGYMVGRQGQGRHFGPGEPVRGIDIADHAEGHHEALNEPGRYEGGWRDKNTGETDLDVSQRFTNHERARHQMSADNEKALFINGKDPHENGGPPQWRDERNMLGHGPGEDSPVHGVLPKNVSPMDPAGLEYLRGLSAKALGR